MAGIRDWLFDSSPSLKLRLLRAGLCVLALPYRFVVGLRNLAYDRHWLVVKRLRIPVICIGNMTVGGTGKTPVVAWVAAYLRQTGRRVAIVSRGYGQLESGKNDEALELELRLPDVPHLQDPDRYAAGRIAQDELDMEVLVLDDGFQHRRLARNLDVVLIDATDPPAAHRLLPAGLMRESWAGLHRASVVLLSRAGQSEPKNVSRIARLVFRYAPHALCIECSYQVRGLRSVASTLTSVDELKRKSVAAFCGIGNPAPFFQMLEQLDLAVVAKRTWPDHHSYTAEDVAELQRWVAEISGCQAVICTMKDWVKLQIATLGAVDLVALEIDVVMSEDNQAAFHAKLDSLL